MCCLPQIIPGSCQDFPLSKSILDPKVSLFHPARCGAIKAYTCQDLVDAGCFRDKTLVIVGDSRGQQLATDLAALLEPCFEVRE